MAQKENTYFYKINHFSKPPVMNKVRTNKILIPVDFSKTSLYAIKYAAFTAKLTKGEVILLHVQKENDLYDIILPALKLKNADAITDFLEEKLEKLAAEIKKKYGVKATAIVSTGNVASEIVTISKETKAGLVVMGTHGKDSTNDLFLGSNSYRVLTKSGTPVMTVQKGADKLGFSKIVLPIDMTAHSRQKVDSAIYMADKFASHIYVLGLLGKNEETDQYSMEIFIEQIKKLAAKKKVVVSGEVKMSTSHAKTTLEYCKKVKADLLVVMIDESSEFSRVILGTDLQHTINESKIPVLCIPPEKHPETAGSDSLGGMW
jgi:nucleotide-binding universal stress UspA family protein